jgi:protein O-mannosyl-transferase
MRARFLLLAAVLTAFGGSLVAGFHLDDYAIFSGPVLKPPHALLRIWGWRQPHPLTNFTFWLNDRIGGQDPLGYHVVNLLLHLGAVLLAYECLRRLLPAAAALVAAALFAVHPLQAEAVNYVAMRGVMLGALLCFAALLLWIEGYPWLAVPAFAAALLADEQCAFFPAVFLIPNLAKGDGIAGRQAAPPAPPCSKPIGPGVGKTVPPVRRSAPFALACMLALAVAAVARLFGNAQTYTLALVSARLLRFLQLLVLPWGFTVAPDPLGPRWLAIAATVLTAAFLLWAWRKRNAHPEVKYLLAGYGLLIPSYSANPAADPRMYLPMFLFAAAAALLLARIPVRQISIGLVVLLVALRLNRTYI